MEVGRIFQVRQISHDTGVQLEVDVGLSADAGWNMAGDREVRNDPSPVKRSSE